MEGKTQQEDREGNNQKLRAEAEKKVARYADKAAPLKKQDLDKLVHELQVHQVELEMQNEELRRAQAELEASQERYFELYDIAPVGYFSISEKGIILEANLTSANMLGVVPRDLRAKRFTSFIFKEDHDIYYLHRRQLFETQAPQVCEIRMVRGDGSLFWARLEAALAQDGKSGEPVCRAVISDIIRQKQAEKELKIKDNTVYSSINAIALADLKGSITYVNPAFLEMWGYSKSEEVLGRTSVSFWQMQEKAEEIIEDLRSKGRWRGELVARRKNGSYFDAQLSANMVTDETGNPICMSGSFVDITEHKQIEQALQESEEKYRLLVENALEAIFIDMDGMLKFANHGATDLTGYLQEELTSRPFIEFIHPYDRQMVSERHVQRLKGMEVPTIYCFRIICKTGDIKWVELSMALITWEGRPATLNFLTDITDRKRLEEERQRVEKLESVGLLAGGIAHDFNNILTAILGNVSLARMEAAPGSGIHDSLEQAEKAALRAKDLTGLLLTFSRGGAPVKKLSSLTELLKDTVSFALRGSNVKCQFSIPADLWNARIDQGQVSQVIHNLVVNARQAMPTGGIIELRAENMALSETQSMGRGLPLKEGNYIRIAVTDHGSGIPEEHLDRIFDPFFTTKQKGSGLGLPTAFSIARQHGGHTSVESVPGSGSTFYLYLPASMEASSPRQDKKEATETGVTARILVMDDEEMVREVAGRMLKHIGCKDIEFATDGAEAVKLYKTAMESGNPFSAVILDLTIPGGMGGIVTMQKLLKIDPGIKAIVSSGYADDSVMAEYRGYGFSGMVAKPYTLEELEKAVHDVMG